MREGMWEVAFKLVMPGMDMPPTKSQQCITAAMIKDPESAIPKMDNGCKISDFKLAGNTATYTMTCTQPMAITAAGEIKYAGPDAYTGTLKVIGPEPALTLSYDAKRIGECRNRLRPSPGPTSAVRLRSSQPAWRTDSQTLRRGWSRAACDRTR
jgi:hypothetical protein